VIAGAHTIVFAEDADAARAFFRDVLELPAVDAGDGWLIFALPPTELACHPGSGWGAQTGQHVLFFMCHDIHETVSTLESRGVDFAAPVTDEGWGLVTSFKVPGAGELGLYEPRHSSPLGTF
jgi:catechol 2,3-dioxygenase-like lactoylglutathione lyase family enzyme